MKNSLLLILVFVIALPSFAQYRPPKKVNKAFLEKYTGATEVNWTKTGERNPEIVYRADYFLEGDTMVTTFDYKGNWLLTIIFIEPGDLPEAVKQEIYEEYMNARLLRAARMEEPGLSSYGVALDFMDSRMEIQFREDGHLIRRRLKSDGFAL